MNTDLQKHPSSSGFSLVELLLTLSVTTALSLAAYHLYSHVRTQNFLKESQESLILTTERIQSSFTLANFESLNTSRALQVQEGWIQLPTDPLTPDVVYLPHSHILRVEVGPFHVSTLTGPLPHGGFQFVLSDIPPSVCSALAAQLSHSFDELILNQVQVQSPQHLFDPARVVELCHSPSSRLQVIFHPTSLHARSLSECVDPTPEERTLNCPSGETGAILERRQGQCILGQSTPTWGPWVELERTCAPCFGPETRHTGCDVGQEGQRAEQRIFDCEKHTWGSWEVLQHACTTCPTLEERTVACEVGQSGERLERRQYFCDTREWGTWLVISQSCTPFSSFK